MKSIIIDGNNNMWRAYSTHRNFIKSHPGVVGMFRIYISLLKKFGNDCVYYFVWDCGKSKERMEIYPEYKKKVKVFTPEEEKAYKEVISEINIFESFLRYLPVYSIKIPGNEGDDIIACISVLVDDSCVIVSTDEDFFQLLVNPKISVYNPIKDIIYDSINFKSIMGIDREKFLLYRSLVGDNSDNIIGVPSIGPKRAREIVLKYEIADIMLDRVDGKFSKLLNKYKDRISLNMSLISFNLSNDLKEKVCNQMKESRVSTVDLKSIEKLLWKYDIVELYDLLKEFV